MNSRNGILFEETNLDLTSRSTIKVILNSNYKVSESIKVNNIQNNFWETFCDPMLFEKFVEFFTNFSKIKQCVQIFCSLFSYDSKKIWSKQFVRMRKIFQLQYI